MKLKLGNLVAGCAAVIFFSAAERAGAITTVADLAIYSGSSSSSVQVGQQMQFFLTLSNGGPGTVVGAITITNQLAAGFQYASSAGNGSYNSNNGAWTVVPGASGNTNFLAITAQVATAGHYTNTVAITVLPVGVTDPNPNNNIARAVVNVTVPQADLGIFKYASTNSVQVGQQMQFYLYLQNYGPSQVAGAITVSDPLPAGFQYVSSAGNGSYTTNTGAWTVVPGYSYDSNFMTITVVATAAGAYINTATITNLPAGVTDPNPSNDTASAFVNVTHPLEAKFLNQGGFLNLLISWPTNLGLALQQSDNLGTTNWTPVTNAPTISNDQYQLILQPTNVRSFYRLVNP